MKHVASIFRSSLFHSVLFAILIFMPAKAIAVLNVIVDYAPPNETFKLINLDVPNQPPVEVTTDEQGKGRKSVAGMGWLTGQRWRLEDSRGRSVQGTFGAADTQTIDASGIASMRGRPSGGQFVKIYAGPGIAQNADINVKSPVGTLKLRDVRLATGVSTGAAVGHWFGNLGFGLDVSYNQNDIHDQMVTGCFAGVCAPGPLRSIRLHTTTVTPTVYKRHALPFGDGNTWWLQGSVGPAISNATAEDSKNFDPERQKHTDKTVGVKVGLGANYRVTSNIGLYVGYGFMHVSHEFNFTEFVEKLKMKVPWNTHSAQFGVSYNFCWWGECRGIIHPMD